MGEEIFECIGELIEAKKDLLDKELDLIKREKLVVEPYRQSWTTSYKRNGLKCFSLFILSG